MELVRWEIHKNSIRRARSFQQLVEALALLGNVHMLGGLHCAGHDGHQCIRDAVEADRTEQGRSYCDSTAVQRQSMEPGDIPDYRPKLDSQETALPKYD